MSNATQPAWYSPPALENLGGGVNKRNYLEKEPVNDETDVGADQYNALCQTAQHAIHTADFAIINATLGSTPVVNYYRSQHAMGAAQGPNITEQATGQYRLTWSTQYADAFSQQKAFTLRDYVVQVHGSTLLFAQPVYVSANVVDIYVWDTSFSAYGSDITATIRVGVSYS